MTSGGLFLLDIAVDVVVQGSLFVHSTLVKKLLFDYRVVGKWEEVKDLVRIRMRVSYATFP
jgi:hypothetical protein